MPKPLRCSLLLLTLALASLLGAERAAAAVQCGGHVATIVGTSGDDTLDGTGGANVIAGLGGNDVINGLGGNDIVCGGRGNDFINGGTGRDLANGQTGHDTCSSPGTKPDRYVSCEDRRPFDFHMDDDIDWGFASDAALAAPNAGDNITTTFRFGSSAVGSSGYRRTLVDPQALLTGTATVLDYSALDLDDGALDINLPFSLPFYGFRYDTVSVGTNGWVSFGAPAWNYFDNRNLNDYRGFPFGVGHYVRGIAPFWTDLDLTDDGPGGDDPGSVTQVVDADVGGPHWVAFQWNAGECCTAEPPRRVFQLVLYDDGRIRFDYVSETPPDSTPQPGFVGLSDGSGPRGVSTYRRSPFTTLTKNQAFPRSTIQVVSTKGFKVPGTIFLDEAAGVTCSGKTATSFTGCTGGTGTKTRATTRVGQPISIPAKSILYTPFTNAFFGAPAGKVVFTLPAGSSFVGSDAGCTSIAPTPTTTGKATCDIPVLGFAENRAVHITWTVPPNIGNGQTRAPNLELNAVWSPVGAAKSTEFDEMMLAGQTRWEADQHPTLVYTGPSPAHVADALTFTATPDPLYGVLAFPVVEIRIPAHMHLDSTTFTGCGPTIPGFGGGSVFCALPSGISEAYSADLTFHANAAGIYKPKITVFANNARTRTGTATITVQP